MPGCRRLETAGLASRRANIPGGRSRNPCKPSVSARIASREGGYSAVEGNSRREFDDDQETKRAPLSRIHGDRRGGSRCRRRRRHLRRLGHGEHGRGAHGRAQQRRRAEHLGHGSRRTGPAHDARHMDRDGSDLVLVPLVPLRRAGRAGRVRLSSDHECGGQHVRPAGSRRRLPYQVASGRKERGWLGTCDVQSDRHRDVGASNEHEGAIHLGHSGGWKPSPGESRGVGRRRADHLFVHLAALQRERRQLQ